MWLLVMSELRSEMALTYLEGRCLSGCLAWKGPGVEVNAVKEADRVLRESENERIWA